MIIQLPHLTLATQNITELILECYGKNKLEQIRLPLASLIEFHLGHVFECFCKPCPGF